MYSKSLLLVFALAVLAFAGTTHNDEVKCAHNKDNEVPLLLDVDEQIHPSLDRTLQTSPKIRITTDYRYLSGDATFVSYVKTQLLPPVIDYYQAALRIKQPLNSALTLPSSLSKICDLTVPSALKTGVLTDFYVLVSQQADTDNWVASASPCYLAGSTRRPLIAKMLFNVYYTKAANGDVLTHEKNMYLTMHEMLHALGFAAAHFPNFLDENGRTQTGQVKKVSLNGVVRTVLDVEPLTTKLRNHFGCSTLPGAFMEDDGGAGTEGSHFERRFFLYEVMTSGVIHGRRVSEFSLAVLDGSGWYDPDYSYAEPFFFGKGEGCNFLYKTCTSSTFNFDEFCDNSGTRGCTPVGRGGGICTSDSRSDNCMYYLPAIELDCENENGEDNARFPELQNFGRTAGSKCFEGDLTRLTSSTSTTFCFNYVCSGTGLSTKLYVKVGSTTVLCSKEADRPKVAGYNGSIYCPDPATFCTTVGKKYCPRNCMGRGTCISGVCSCKTGYKGVDCALPTNWT
jgi:hypothetical protein